MQREKVFLSYRREDAPQVASLRETVKAAGYEPVDAPPSAILHASYFIACVSTHGHVDGELQLAIEQLRSGQRGASWLKIVPLREAAAVEFPAAGYPALPESTGRLDLHTEAGDVQAPTAEVFALKADQDAIEGQHVRSYTKVGNVTGDNAAVVGVVLTGTRKRRP